MAMHYWKHQPKLAQMPESLQCLQNPQCESPDSTGCKSFGPLRGSKASQGSIPETQQQSAATGRGLPGLRATYGRQGCLEHQTKLERRQDQGLLAQPQLPRGPVRSAGSHDQDLGFSRLELTSVQLFFVQLSCCMAARPYCSGTGSETRLSGFGRPRVIGHLLP